MPFSSFLVDSKLRFGVEVNKGKEGEKEMSPNVCICCVRLFSHLIIFKPFHLPCMRDVYHHLNKG